MYPVPRTSIPNRSQALPVVNLHCHPAAPHQHRPLPCRHRRRLHRQRHHQNQHRIPIKSIARNVATASNRANFATKIQLSFRRNVNYRCRHTIRCIIFVKFEPLDIVSRPWATIRNCSISILMVVLRRVYPQHCRQSHKLFSNDQRVWYWDVRRESKVIWMGIVWSRRQWLKGHRHRVLLLRRHRPWQRRWLIMTHRRDWDILFIFKSKNRYKKY